MRVFEVAKMTLLTGLLSLTAIAAQGQTFQNIGNFTSSNGAWFPNAPLTQGPNGILYGTTQRGGTHGDGNSGGTVFQLALNSSTVTTLYNFCSQVNSIGVCTDGEFTNGGLILDSDGNFYGTTAYGGGNTNTGSVFKLTSGRRSDHALRFLFGQLLRRWRVPADGVVAGHRWELLRYDFEWRGLSVGDSF